jgi:hypothetical protein
MSEFKSPAHSANHACVATETGGWDCESERQIGMWMKTAQLNSAINELAALYYTKLNNLAVILVSILTVIVGSKGVANFIAGDFSGISIATSICEILLGISASLLTNMELKTKSVNFNKRAVGFGKLASYLRVQLVLRPEERVRKMDLLQSIPERVEYLDDLADPLPLKYRDIAEHSKIGGIINMWSKSGAGGVTVAIAPETTHQQTASSDDSSVYDGKTDVEGSIDSIIRTIIGQRL